MAITTGCKRTGKGTIVSIQRACSADPTVADYNCSSIQDETAGSSAVCLENAEWLNLGCLFSVQPPSIAFDTVTGEQCLKETGAPTTELGDVQDDNPSFTVPFCPDDPEYQMLEDGCLAGTCFLIKFQYPGTDVVTGNPPVELFFGFILSVEPDEINRNDFMQSTITILRSSGIYNSCNTMPTAGAFDCASCRISGALPLGCCDGVSVTTELECGGNWVVGECP